MHDEQLRTYDVTLARDGEHYLYRITVDVDAAARQQAVLEARVKAAGEYDAPTFSFALWSVREVGGA